MTAAGSAQAAVPDHWGFAFVNNPSVAGVPVLSHQAGSWPAVFHVHSAPAAGMRVLVRFPRIASKNGVVHVTAVNQGAVWCQALSWVPSGPDEVVGVRCYKAGGAPVFSPFTVMYTTSSGAAPAGPQYGYVHFSPASGIVARYNSAGGVNTVTPGLVGVWAVKMPGLGSAVQQGNVQVTAVNPTVAAKCEVQKWAWGPGAQAFIVRCFNGGTTPLKTGWTLTYNNVRAVTGTVPKNRAYTFDNKPLLAGPYVPAPPGINFNSLGGTNNVRSAGGGLRLVTFPREGLLPDTVLVSPFRSGPGFCNLLTVWATVGGPTGVLVRDVACYTAGGAHKNTASLVTYTAAH